MAKPKRPKDGNQRAKLIMEIATGEVKEKDPDEGKSWKAVKAGKIGGAKGGKARAKNLSAKRRKAIAKKAAKARWGK